MGSGGGVWRGVGAVEVVRRREVCEYLSGSQGDGVDVVRLRAQAEHGRRRRGVMVS